jgi:hypothetical protein
MTIYIVTFLSIMIFGALNPYLSINFKNLTVFILIFFLLIFVGLRNNVGGDWGSYQSIFSRYNSLNFNELFINDLGYDFLNWTVAKIGGEIYLVNFICAIFFVIPLILFINKLDYFALPLAIAFTYLITIVAMGYVRQSVAIGFFLFGLNILNSKKNNIRVIIYFFLIFCAFLFHKSAIILLSLIPFMQISKTNKLLFLSISFLIILQLLFNNFYGNFYERYIATQMESRGAFLRILMNYPPALLFIYYYKYFKNDNLASIFLGISIFSIFSLFLIPFASTFIDRISLYFIILQIYFWPKFIHLNKFSLRAPIYCIIFLIYFLSFFVWMTNADHKDFWIPYKTILFYENYNNF